MNKKVHCLKLIDIVEEANNPFSRENSLAQIKAEYGEGILKYYSTGNGIAIANVSHKLNQNIIATLDYNIPSASLIFNLGNDILYKFNNNHEYLFKKNTFFLGFSNENFTVDMHFNKNIINHTFTVDIQEELFKELTQKDPMFEEKIQEAKDNSYSFFNTYEIDLEQKEMLEFFKEKDQSEYLSTNLQMEAKTINFILYTIDKIKKSSKGNSNINQEIITSLQKAKKIILSDYASALSIKEIAYRSAINECYLKKEFKSYYGQTVFEMLQKQRLDEAKKLLKQNLSVKEVALKVGYKHSGNFSKLFLNHFGVSPSNYRKQINNY